MSKANGSRARRPRGKRSQVGIRQNVSQQISGRRVLLRIRTPIALPHGRPLRICSVARISTDEQRRQSIRAQHRLNRSAIESLGIETFVIEEVSDEGWSGELRDRPGVRRLYEGIAERDWDLIICEDSSRLYRNLQFCLELVGAAVDKRIRVVCIGDDVDTAEEDWDERLNEAQQHHCRSNKFTRRRIRRAIEDLWEEGAAVGKLRSGYVRQPTVPATKNRPAEGPSRDHVSKKWRPFVVKSFQKVARRDPLREIVAWLTSVGLPRTNNAPGPWTVSDLRSMIRCELYRGREFHGRTRATKKYSSGKSVQEPAKSSDEIRFRKMPHLRMVSDALWLKANAVLDSRTPIGHRPRGEAHVLHGIPRDSRGPLRHFVCDICGNKVYQDGRNEGGYKCGHSQNGRDNGERCWNKATALRELTHHQISTAVVHKILSVNEAADPLSEYIKQIHLNEGHWQTVENRLKAEVRKLDGMCVRLLAAIESLDTAPERLTNQLQKRSEQLSIKQAELAQVRLDRRRPRAAPSPKAIRAAIESSTQALLELNRDAGALLERLICGPILAVPYQQFGSNKVVLRAQFTLNLVHVLPGDLTAWLAGTPKWKPDKWFPPIIVEVDLFNPTAVPKNALWAAELFHFLTVREVGTVLGISKRVARQAVHLGQAMSAAGITDPYVRLVKRPKAASRWRFKSEAPRRKKSRR